jgi:hypothetical protein
MQENSCLKQQQMSKTQALKKEMTIKYILEFKPPDVT